MTTGPNHLPIEEMEVFKRYVSVADWVWGVVERWPELARNTVGEQLIRACDSVGANLVEGDGRGTDPDSLRFFIIARASAREARYWVSRAIARGLISREEGTQKVDEVVSATQLLNRLIGYRRAAVKGDRIREGLGAPYAAGPFDVPLESL